MSEKLPSEQIQKAVGTYISDCCDASVIVAGVSATRYWVCTQCWAACDTHKRFKPVESTTFKPVADFITFTVGPRCKSKDAVDFPDLADNERCQCCLLWEAYDAYVGENK